MPPLVLLERVLSIKKLLNGWCWRWQNSNFHLKAQKLPLAGPPSSDFPSSGRPTPAPHLPDTQVRIAGWFFLESVVFLGKSSPKFTAQTVTQVLVLGVSAEVLCAFPASSHRISRVEIWSNSQFYCGTKDILN